MNTLHHPPKQTALIIGGGGLKVAGVFGALRVIEQERIPFDSMYCVSRGNSPGGLFLTNGGTTKPGEELWLDMMKDPSILFEYRNVLRMALSPLKMPSLCTIGYLLVLVKTIDIPRLVSQPKRFVVSVTRVPSKKEIGQGVRLGTEYFATDDPEIQKNPDCLGWAIAASCSIVGVFEPVPIKYHGSWGRYIDGTYKCALPIKKAIEDGHDTIIVIRSHSNRIIKPYPEGWLDGLVYSTGIRHNEMEEEEIRLVRAEYPDVNLFVVEPDDFPETLNTMSAQPSDFLEVMDHLESVARRVCAPLIEYYRWQRRIGF